MRGKLVSRGIAITSIITGLCSAKPASAVPVEFNLRDTSAAAEIESGVITRDGITATLTPLVLGNSGALNQISSSFGIDAAILGGSPHDASALLDGVDGAESISIIFDTDVLFTGTVLSILSAGEEATISLGAFPEITLTDTGSGSDSFAFGTQNQLAAGTSVLLKWNSGNGFSFDSFTVEQWIHPVGHDSTSVPDGGNSLALLGCSLASLGLISHRRHQT